MSTLLALDTSTQLCSVALSHKGEVIEKVVDIGRDHTRYLLPLIDELLSSSDISLNTLDAIALTAGPGSFTGLRIGMGVAQGLAFGADLPVIRISTLQTLAQGAICAGSTQDDELILPMLDARMNEVYWGLYYHKMHNQETGMNRGLAREMSVDRVSKPELILEALNGVLDSERSPGRRLEDISGVGEGWHYASELRAEIRSFNPNARPLARDIIPLAREKLFSGEILKPEALEPYYIRDKIHWKKRKRLR